MKTCSKCKEDKPKTEFSKDATRVGGLHPWCRGCRSINASKHYRANKSDYDEKTRRWRAENPEKSLEISRRSHYANKENRNAYCRKYREDNTERMRYLSRKWSRDNPDRAREICANRRAAKLMATPIWASSEFDRFAMSEAYSLSSERTRKTGIEWHVDHIVPLRSKKVCGLHCMANVQVIPGADNHSKGNRVWPNM